MSDEQEHEEQATYRASVRAYVVKYTRFRLDSVTSLSELGTFAVVWVVEDEREGVTVDRYVYPMSAN